MISGRLPRMIQVLTFLTIIVAFVPAGLWAQGDDDEDGGPVIPTSTLSVTYDQGGQADVFFSTYQDVEDWAPLKASLEKSLSCPAGALGHAAPSKYPGAYLNKLPLKQRQQVEAQLAKVRLRRVHGRCFGDMRHGEFILSTDLPLQDVLAEVKRIGDQQLSVFASFPISKYYEYPPGLPSGLYSYGNMQLSHVNYLFKTDGSESPRVHLAFGYRKKDVYRALAVPAALLLLPLVLVFWMQRAAIRGAKDDPTAAWFSYFRVLNWCTLGTMLFWIAGHSARQGLEDLAAYRFPNHSAAGIGARIAIMMVPPWLVYLLCLLSSHRVYVRVRGLIWSRREFYAAQILQVAAQAVPSMCLIAGIELLSINPRWSMALFASIYFFSIILARLRLKITGTHPEAITTGELRDRVFELAKRAATELRQVMVMPAGRSQMANAFASGSKMVIFTDYLLARMNKGEVIAVAAHEITHLQKRHVTWKALGIVVLVLSPMALHVSVTVLLDLLRAQAGLSPAGGAGHLVSAIQGIDTFPELDLIFYLVGLSLFYLQSRILENSADAGAVRLTGDPEALMTALLKLGRLNLMPVQWGRIAGTLLTHPSTMKRIERIARAGQITPERLQQIVAEYRQKGDAASPQEAIPPKTEESFVQPAALAGRIVSSAKASQSAMSKLWILLFFHIAPAVSAAYVLHRLPLHGWALAAAYLGAVVMCVASYSIVTRWMGVWGHRRLQEQFETKMRASGLTVVRESAMFVGFAPDAMARFYVSNYNWDNGYLFLTKDRLCYVGDLTSFALRFDQIRDVRIDAGVPGWFPVQRVYMDWWDENRCTLRTCNFGSMRPVRFWHGQREALHLHAWLCRWRFNPSSYPQPLTPLAVLEGPGFGEVTSRSIKPMHTMIRAVGLAFWIVVLAIAACTILNVPDMLYVCGVVLLLRVYEHLPFWRYEERPMVAQAVVAMAAGIGNSNS